MNLRQVSILRSLAEDFTMNMRVLFLIFFVVSMAVFGQVGGGTLPLAPPVVPEADGVYQIHYLANLNVGDSYLNLTNARHTEWFRPRRTYLCERLCV